MMRTLISINGRKAILSDDMAIASMERRFKEVTGICHDMAVFPCAEKNIHQKTSPEDIERYGFVTTPLHIVDAMVMMELNGKEKPWETESFADMCCGCGQFSIRLLRCMYNMDSKFGIAEYIMDKLLLVELNPESIAKAIYVYDGMLNMMMGDASRMKIGNRYSGLMFHDGNDWFNDDDFTVSVFNILGMKEDMTCKIHSISEEIKARMTDGGYYRAGGQMELF